MQLPPFVSKHPRVLRQNDKVKTVLIDMSRQLNFLIEIFFELCVGELTRSSDDLRVGVRCFVKYDQFYYPAIIHELLGNHTSKVKVAFCDQMMTKAVSVDRNDILLITDLEVGMRTVARNIINKEEWVPCKIIAKHG
jgi:hypothetical protein